MKLLRVMTIIAVLMTSIWVVAQEDSRANEPNWCHAGEPWGDGRCNDPDPIIQEYNWQIGWLFAQCDLGNIARETCYPPVEVEEDPLVIELTTPVEETVVSTDDGADDEEIQYAFRSISGTPEAESGSFGVYE